MGTGDLCRWHRRPVPVGPGLELPLATWRSPGLEFSPKTDPVGPLPTGPYYNLHMVPFLNFAWLSRGVVLLQVAKPEVEIQVRDLVRVVGIVVPFVPRGGVGIRGKFVLSCPGG